MEWDSKRLGTLGSPKGSTISDNKVPVGFLEEAYKDDLAFYLEYRVKGGIDYSLTPSRSFPALRS